MKNKKRLIFVGLALVAILGLGSCSSVKKSRLASDKLPINMGSNYEGNSENDGYFIKSTGKLFFNHKKSTISDGENTYKYKVVDSNKLTEKPKKTIESYNEQTKGKDVFFLVIDTSRNESDSRINYQFGYELAVSKNGKNIEFLALNKEYDFLEFSGEVND